MKMLSFNRFSITRDRKTALLKLDSQEDKIELGAGLHLIIGRNGQGKSTLLQTLAGIIAPLTGEAFLDQAKLDPKSHVSYVPEYLNFPKFIYPSEWVEFKCGKVSQSEFDRLLKLYDLTTLRKKFMGRMSLGERRKLTWITASLSKKPVLLLDEPFNGLDFLSVDSTLTELKKWKSEGRITLIVAHQLGELLALKPSIWLIRNGKMEQLKNQGSDLEALRALIHQSLEK